MLARLESLSGTWPTFERYFPQARAVYILEIFYVVYLWNPIIICCFVNQSHLNTSHIWLLKLFFCFRTPPPILAAAPLGLGGQTPEMSAAVPLVPTKQVKICLLTVIF